MSAKVKYPDSLHAQEMLDTYYSMYVKLLKSAKMIYTKSDK